MLVKVQHKNSSDPFYIYDIEDLKDLSLDDFGLEVLSESPELSEDLPIYPLNELLIKRLGYKKRTESQRLEECGIFTYHDLCEEYLKILAKESNLSRSQRDLVAYRFKEIANVIAPEEEQDTPDVSD